jgi:hypothetical protein
LATFRENFLLEGPEGGLTEEASGGAAELLVGEGGFICKEGEVLAGEAVDSSVLFSRKGGTKGSDHPV